MLVALAIVAILSGLTLAAVQQARGAARRLACTSNLKQLGIALNNYQSAYRMYPAGMGATGHDESHDFRSVWLRLAPMLAYQGVTPPAETVVFWPSSGVDPFGLLTCPADRTAQGPETNYRVNTGPDAYYGSGFSRAATGWPGLGEGPFELLHYRAPRDFTRGLSQTVGAAERKRGDRNDNRVLGGGDFADNVVVGPPFPTADGMIELCSGTVEPAWGYRSQGGHDWGLSGYFNTWYNHAAPPAGGATTDCFAAIAGLARSNHFRAGGIVRASSFHGDGVNALLMDGAVRYHTAATDTQVWRTLGTR